MSLYNSNLLPSSNDRVDTDVSALFFYLSCYQTAKITKHQLTITQIAECVFKISMNHFINVKEHSLK